MRTRLMSVLLLSWVLIAAPVAPAFSASAPADDPHAGHHSPMPAGPATQTSDLSGPCSELGTCDGQCCATCAQCSNAVFFAFPHYDHSHPVQTPASIFWNSRIWVASPQRPPSPVVS